MAYDYCSWSLNHFNGQQDLCVRLISLLPIYEIMISTKDGYEHTQTYFSTDFKTILVAKKKKLYLKRQIAYFARGFGTAREVE